MQVDAEDEEYNEEGFGLGNLNRALEESQSIGYPATPGASGSISVLQGTEQTCLWAFSSDSKQPRNGALDRSRVCPKLKHLPGAQLRKRRLRGCTGKRGLSPGPRSLAHRESTASSQIMLNLKSIMSLSKPAFRVCGNISALWVPSHNLFLMWTWSTRNRKLRLGTKST
jgi:hypothetical protein